MTRKHLQTGTVRLRKDGNPPYWEGFYREDVVTEAGKRVRRRRAVNLGSMKDLSKKADRRKLAAMLEPINQTKCKTEDADSFRGFIAKYRELKLANKKRTTVHGYETNINAHFLPEFGNMQLSEITIESVQDFINLKAGEGKAVHTLKNLKWGLSSIFVAAVKYGYMDSNPVRAIDLPPHGGQGTKAAPNGRSACATDQRSRGAHQHAHVSDGCHFDPSGGVGI